MEEKKNFYYDTTFAGILNAYLNYMREDSDWRAELFFARSSLYNIDIDSENGKVTFMFVDANTEDVTVDLTKIYY